MRKKMLHGHLPRQGRVGISGQQRRDRVGQAQPALLDQLQYTDSGEHLAHRPHAEPGCRRNRARGRHRAITVGFAKQDRLAFRDEHRAGESPVGGFGAELEAKAVDGIAFSQPPHPEVRRRLRPLEGQVVDAILAEGQHDTGEPIPATITQPGGDFPGPVGSLPSKMKPPEASRRPRSSSRYGTSDGTWACTKST